MKKKIFFTLVYSFIPLLWRGAGAEIYAQNKTIDSLQSQLKKINNQQQSVVKDTSIINCLNALSWELMYINLDTAIKLSEQALTYSKKIINSSNVVLACSGKKGAANSYGQLGSYDYLKDNYPKAIDNYLKGLKLYEEIKNKKGIVNLLGNLGLVYANESDYPKALSYYHKALKMDEEAANKAGVARHLGNIGTLYAEQENFTLALKYYGDALKIAEEFNNKKLIATWLGNIGSVYLSQGDSALRKGNSKLAKTDKFKKALAYHLKALKIKEELGAINLIANAHGNIGALYAKAGNFKEAESYLKRAIVLNDSIGALKQLMDAEEYISFLYDTTGRKALALFHYKKHIAIRDSINSIDNQKAQVQTEMNYEFEKKELATKAEQDKKDAIASEEKQKQKLILLFVFGGLLIVALFSLSLYKRFKITQEQKIIIEDQKQEVDKAYQHLHEKNKEVMDSIIYARRIQLALITPEKYITKQLYRLTKRKV